ncbi:MAG: DNA primase [Anaerolineae bacterium]|nr:DNA primase [Anaerolineae bacterium]
MSVVEEVRSRLDIVEVIGEYVKLTRVGRNYRGFSPFKSERTPSFFVFPHTQTFKDFSSGEQGDVFAFVMKKEGWTFREALRELARRAGVQLEEQTPERQRAQSYEQRLREALAEAAAYFHRLLLSAPQAQPCLRYLREKRHLTDETIAKWKLGYSLADYHALSAYLTERGFSSQELLDAGLLVENEAGWRYDRFRGRLMIPICDARGQVVGFGSRSLDGSEPKYMNSPQTALFDKGQLLFGLDQARNAIRSAQVAVLVEGYMDVIGCHQAGFTNVVAGMGTSLTEAQLSALKRLAGRIVLALDADAAGARAIWRSLDVARESLERTADIGFDPRGAIRVQSRLNADLRVALLPEGKDPDEIVLESPETWSATVDKARPIVEHVLEALLTQYDVNDAFQKSQAIKAALPILLDTADPIQRDTYVQYLARRAKVSERSLAQAIQAAERSARTRDKSQTATSPAQEPNSGGERRPQTAWALEVHLLALILKRPELIFDVNAALTRAGLTVLGEEDFTNPALRQGFRTLYRAALGERGSASDDGDDWLEMIADHDLRGNAADSQDTARALHQGVDVEDPNWQREEAIRTALRMRLNHAERDRLALSALIEEATRIGTPGLIQQHHAQLSLALSRLLYAQKALHLRGSAGAFD